MKGAYLQLLGSLRRGDFSCSQLAVRLPEQGQDPGFRVWGSGFRGWEFRKAILVGSFVVLVLVIARIIEIPIVSGTSNRNDNRKANRKTDRNSNRN